MLALIVILCSSLTFGSVLLAVLRLRIDRPFLRYVLAVSSGLCLWMYVLFALGHLGLCWPWLLCGIGFSAALVVFVVLMVRPDLLREIRAWVRAFSSGGWLYVTTICLVIVVTFIASFAPVTGGIRNDEICLHLSIVREWLSTGYIHTLPDAISYQAGNAHLLLLLAGAIGGATGQRLVSWLCFVLCLGVIYVISRTFLNKKYSLLAAMIAAINPLVYRGASVAFVDVPSSLFVLLPIATLLCYRRDRRVGWLVLCSLFLGAGAGIKPTNIVYDAAFCLASLCYALAKRVKLKELLSAAVIIAALGGACAAPWPIRLMVLTGSPVFPPPLVLYKNGGLKPLRGGTAPFTYSTVKGYYDYVKSRYGEYRRTPGNFIVFPWEITMNPGRFQIGDSIGTLFLCLLPCILFICPFPLIVGFLLLMAIGAAVPLYFVVAPEARYYIGGYMALCPVLAYTARRLEKRNSIRAAVRAVIILNCVYSLMVLGRVAGSSMIAAVNCNTAERMKKAHIPFYEAFEFIRQNRITDIMVFHTPQNLYYLPQVTRYHTDESLMSKIQTMHGIYIFDMDYSQVLERNFSLMRGDFTLSPRTLPASAVLIFTGPDARIYRL
jgi:hypothetical protein